MAALPHLLHLPMTGVALVVAVVGGGCADRAFGFDDELPRETVESRSCVADGHYIMQIPEEYLAVEITPPQLPWTPTAVSYEMVSDGPCETSYPHALLLGVFEGPPPPPSDEGWISLHPGSSAGTELASVHVSLAGSLTVDSIDQRLWVAFNSGPLDPNSEATACPRTCDDPEADARWYWFDDSDTSGAWLVAPDRGVFAVVVDGQ